jgi:hypothetical protein
MTRISKSGVCGVVLVAVLAVGGCGSDDNSSKKTDTDTQPARKFRRNFSGGSTITVTLPPELRAAARGEREVALNLERSLEREEVGGVLRQLVIKDRGTERFLFNENHELKRGVVITVDRVPIDGLDTPVAGGSTVAIELR